LTDNPGKKHEKEKQKQKEKLSLPMAPVVRIMRKNLDKDKIIKKKVKVGMNKWLAKMCTKVTKKINEKPYATVNVEDFKDAIEKYNAIDEVEKEKARIVAHLRKIIEDCDSLIRDLDRKFKA
jgi:histone H3/H4